MNINVQNIWDKLVDLSLSYGPKLLLAIIVLIAGFWIIKKLLRLTDKLMEKRNVELSLRNFLKTLINIILKVLLLISVLQMAGVETTSFIAMLGAAGLAIGMALQGSLSNFAGGVLILLFKPYKVGDLIEAQGYTGVVEDIQIFSTKLTTAQGLTIIIPNSAQQRQHRKPQCSRPQESGHRIWHRLFRRHRPRQKSAHGSGNVSTRRTQRPRPFLRGIGSRRQFGKHQTMHILRPQRLLGCIFPQYGKRQKTTRKSRRQHTVPAARSQIEAIDK